jgi:hypothetical protein
MVSSMGEMSSNVVAEATAGRRSGPQIDDDTLHRRCRHPRSPSPLAGLNSMLVGPVNPTRYR